MLEASCFSLRTCLTRGDGELNLEEYHEALREVDETMQDIKQKFHISGINAGLDAQVEVKPHQEPFVGGGTRMYCVNNSKSCEMEAKFESLLMDWITKRDVKLTNTFSTGWEPTRTKTNRLDFWEQNAASEVEDHRLCCNSHQLGNKEHGGKELLCSKLD